MCPAPLGHEPYSGCETGGRPTKYSQEFIEAEADAFKAWLKQPDAIYIKRFAIDRGYSPQRLSEFAAQNEKFSEALEFAKDFQECKLVEGALTKTFSDGFTQFVLINNHDWKNKQETKVSGDALNPLSCVLNLVDGKSKDLIHDDSAE